MKLIFIYPAVPILRRPFEGFLYLFGIMVQKQWLIGGITLWGSLSQDLYLEKSLFLTHQPAKHQWSGVWHGTFTIIQYYTHRLFDSMLYLGWASRIRRNFDPGTHRNGSKLLTPKINGWNTHFDFNWAVCLALFSAEMPSVSHGYFSGGQPQFWFAHVEYRAPPSVIL